MVIQSPTSPNRRLTEILRKGTIQLRYLVVITGISLGSLLLVELAGWVLSPERYQDPPAVTADAWIHSDALNPQDTTQLKEFVEEFCQSYKAHWTSYVYYRRNPFTGKLITIDTNGIRYTPRWSPHPNSSDPSLRIFLFGGSTMWGTGVRDSGTIPSALSRLIASDSGEAPAQVVNMGESGYVSMQEIIALEVELRKGNIPDVVITYDGVNDVFSTYQNARAGLPENEMNRVTEFNLLKDGGRMRALGLNDFLKRTVTASVVNSIRAAFSPAQPSAPSHVELAENVERLYRGNLKILESLARQFGFRYEAYWQPVVFAKKGLSPYQQKQSDQFQYLRSLFLEVYRRVEQDSVLLADPQFHNISSIFDSIAVPVYLDFCHITETGNAIIARRMYADIRSSLHRR